MRNVLSGLREALKGGSLAAFIVRNRIRRGSLLELDSILASLALEAGFRVEALYSSPAPKSLWVNLLSKKGLRLPCEGRIITLKKIMELMLRVMKEESAKHYGEVRIHPLINLGIV
jgi:hypothetical protein